MTHLVRFCMFICFRSVLQLKVHCQGNFQVDLFQDAIVHDVNNTGPYSLGLHIDSLDRNRLCTTEKTRHQNRELSTEKRALTGASCTSIFRKFKTTYLYVGKVLD